MRFYPVNLSIAGRACLVIGGGRVAARKAQGLLACGARVAVISPDLSPPLAALEKNGEINWIARPYRPGDLANTFLVIAATDDQAAQLAIQEEAERENILLNIADVPHLCNFILPSILRRGDLTIAVSTGGRSPALAKQIREQLENHFGPEYEMYLDLLGTLRTAILAAGEGSDPDASRTLLQNLPHPHLPEWIQKGDWQRIELHLQTVLAGRVDSSCLAELEKRFKPTSFAGERLR